MTCDTATTLKKAVDRLSNVSKVLGGEKSLINGTWSMPMFCSATTGYFTIPSKKGETSNAVKYRLGYAPDRRPEAAKAELNWDNLNLRGSHYHYPLTDGKDLLTLAAFNQDAAAWRPETIIRRGELPGGFRTCVDWRFIGGIPPVANGKVRIRSRRRSINFKRHNQRGSTCLFTGFRNAVAVARCAQLGELAREPLLGNVAYQEMVMYTTVDNGPSNVPLRTYINVYRTVDNTSNYVWLNTYDTKKGNISCIPQNKDSPALTYVQVKSDPTTKAILNKDYYLDTDQHKYVYEADPPDSTTASRAFTAHTMPSLVEDNEPDAAVTDLDESTTDGDTDYALQTGDIEGQAFPLTDEERALGSTSRSTKPDWSEPGNKDSSSMLLYYYLNEFDVDPNLKPYIDSRYLPTVKNPHDQTTLCGGSSCYDQDEPKTIKTYTLLKFKRVGNQVCGKDKSVPPLYLKCFDGESWFPFQPHTDVTSKKTLRSWFGDTHGSLYGYFGGVSYSLGYDDHDSTTMMEPVNSHYWQTGCKNQPIFTLGDLAYASPALFIMLAVDMLGPQCISRTGPRGGSKTCYDIMANTLGMDLDFASQLVHPEYLMDGSGSKTDVAMRQIMYYLYKAPYAESYHPGFTSGHSPALVGYCFHATAPEESFFIIENSHWTSGNTYHGSLIYKINFTHAWAGMHRIMTDFTSWNHNMETGKGGFGRPVRYYYDGTVELPGDFASLDIGKEMGSTNEVRGASKYDHRQTVDFDPSGETLAYIGDGGEDHCGVGKPCAAHDTSVVPTLLPNYNAARSYERTNADTSNDFSSFTGFTCDAKSSTTAIKTATVSNQVDAASKCTGDCNFVNIDGTTATFYQSCDAVVSSNSSEVVLQRKSTLPTLTDSMRIIETYYGDYRDVCLTKDVTKFSAQLAVPSGYRLVNGPGCTSGGTTSTQKSLSNCAKKCTGDCSHATFDHNSKLCRVCTGVYSPTERGPCDLLTVRPVPRGAAPSISTSEYSGFQTALGHFCENPGFTSSVAIDTKATTLAECANSCKGNPLCNFAQMQEGVCALLDVCPEYYPTDDDTQSVLIRRDYTSAPTTVVNGGGSSTTTTPTTSDGTGGGSSTAVNNDGDTRSTAARLRAIDFVPLIVCLLFIVPLAVVLGVVIPRKVTDPRHLLVTRLLFGITIAVFGLLGTAITTKMSLDDVHAVADIQAKQYIGVA